MSGSHITPSTNSSQSAEAKRLHHSNQASTRRKVQKRSDCTTPTKHKLVTPCRSEAILHHSNQAPTRRKVQKRSDTAPNQPSTNSSQSAEAKRYCTKSTAPNHGVEAGHGGGGRGWRREVGAGRGL